MSIAALSSSTYIPSAYSQQASTASAAPVRSRDSDGDFDGSTPASSASVQGVQATSGSLGTIIDTKA